jgi:hypothetical protein
MYTIANSYLSPKGQLEVPYGSLELSNETYNRIKMINIIIHTFVLVFCVSHGKIELYSNIQTYKYAASFFLILTQGKPTIMFLTSYFLLAYDVGMRILYHPYHPSSDS